MFIIHIQYLNSLTYKTILKKVKYNKLDQKETQNKTNQNKTNKNNVSEYNISSNTKYNTAMIGDSRKIYI